MHVRVCRDCGEEYRPDIVACADCGGELEDRHEDEQGRPSVAAGTAPAGDVEQTVPVRALFTGPPGSVKPLANTLVAAGIPFRLLAAEGPGPRIVLFVAEAEADRALEALASFAGRGTEMGFVELAATFHAGEGAHDAACPACHAAIAPGATSCPECGLELGGAEEP